MPEVLLARSLPHHQAKAFHIASEHNLSPTPVVAHQPPCVTAERSDPTRVA